jgi:hypothetical protein
MCIVYVNGMTYMCSIYKYIYTHVSCDIEDRMYWDNKIKSTKLR